MMKRFFLCFLVVTLGAVCFLRADENIRAVQSGLLARTGQVLRGDLGKLWFALEEGVTPPSYVYIELNDLNAAQPNSHGSEIRALVEEKVGVNGPGAAVLVSRAGVPLHMAGYGLADLKAGTRITPDSLFDLASVSKNMTGVAIMTLVEKGKLKLDQPVAKYVEDFAVPVKGRAVILLDLLHHVSGLADYTSDDWEGSDEEFATLTNERHLIWLNRTRPRRAPGVKYDYNNSGYALLALIVERVSGQSFARYVRDHRH